MLARLAALTLALAAIPAVADDARFTSVTYECDQLKATTDRNGVLCAVGHTGVQPALYIKVLTKISDPDEKKKRTSYVVDKMTQSFYAAGGKQVIERSTNKAGSTIERSCSRSARFPSGMCGDWYPVAAKE